MPTRFLADGYSRKGRRDYQQDAYDVSRTRLLVCDGMGGHEGGDKASAAAVAVAKAWKDTANIGGLFMAAQSVIAKAAGTPEAGTTMVLVQTTGSPSRLVCAAVGDSPAYHWSSEAKRLKLLYYPHRDAGGGLLKGLFGFDSKHKACMPTVVHFTVKPGDLIVVGSDGLIDGSSTLRVLNQVMLENERERPGLIARRLVDAAYAAGSEDNITAVVGRVTKS